MSMDELSRQAGVSKSMLSQIERNQANPTVAVVWRLANALGVPMVDLLSGSDEHAAPELQTVPAHAIPALRSPDGLCELHILSPIELAGQFEWYRLEMLPGGVLASTPHDTGTQEHLTVMSGDIEVHAGDDKTRLQCDETARYAADQPHAIRNTGTQPARALLVVVHAT